MSDTVVYSQPGYILKQQHYRETSLIIDVLTRDLGRLSILAKGVRTAKSKTLGLIRPFTALLFSFTGKSGLKTLIQIEMAGIPGTLSGMTLYYGFYVNELVCNFLHKDDPHPEVFLDYQVCINRLSQSQFLESALRVFELNLLDNIGYGIPFEHDIKFEKPIESGKKYRLNKAEGFIEDSQGFFSGAALLAMQRREFSDPIVLNEAKILLRSILDSRLQGKRLKSRPVINNILKRL